jgi:hypothetical protein
MPGVLGGAASATPAGYSLFCGEDVTGVSNTAGGNCLFKLGNSTGTANTGFFDFLVPKAGSTGSTPNTLTTIMRVNATGQIDFMSGSFGNAKICIENTAIGTCVGRLSRDASTGGFVVDTTSGDMIVATGSSAGDVVLNSIASTKFIRFKTNNTDRWDIDQTGMLLANTDNSYDVGATGVSRPRSLYAATDINIESASNGAQWKHGYATELLTLSTGGTTTDTTANLLPANAIIEAVEVRVTTTITTATNWSVGDPTTAARFCAANSTLTAGTTSSCTLQADQTGASGPRQTAAAKVRITTTGTPGAGAIRITVFYRIFTPPTS